MLCHMTLMQYCRIVRVYLIEEKPGRQQAMQVPRNSPLHCISHCQKRPGEDAQEGAGTQAGCRAVPQRCESIPQSMLLRHTTAQHGCANLDL